ncbi:MAG: hypothetical protein JKX92_05940 [Porticoccaceae bacterium]|nr:hypothetical protein [Porticoccaceae bacterium]
MNAAQRIPPIDALCRIGNSYYKIGLRDRPFRWDGEEWISSTIGADVVRCAERLGNSLPVVGDKIETLL